MAHEKKEHKIGKKVEKEGKSLKSMHKGMHVGK